jgi:LEA14-like dessication related protein
MRTRPTLILAFLILSLTACGALSPMAEKPQVTVRSLSLSSAGFSGMDGEVAMDIYNPNGFGLPLNRVDWTLSVGSAQAVRGSFEMSETIPAKGSAPVTGRLHIDVSSAVGVAAAVASGVRTYDIQATLHFQTRLGELTVAVSHRGELL